MTQPIKAMEQCTAVREGYPPLLGAAAQQPPRLGQELEEPLQAALAADLGKPAVKPFSKLWGYKVSSSSPQQRGAGCHRARGLTSCVATRPQLGARRALGTVDPGPLELPRYAGLRALVSALAAGNTAVLEPSSRPLLWPNC